MGPGMTAHAPSSRRRLLPDRWSTRTGFAALTLVNVVALWFIIPSGGLVRLTKSGLGCPDWPLCNGGVVPEASYHATIEYTNRLASAAVMVIAVVTWLASRRVPGGGQARRMALVAMAASVAQVPLGGVTVMLDLHPLMVASHFLLSVIALSGAVLCALAAHDVRDGRARRADARRGPLAWVALVVLAAVVVSGVLTTAAGPHSGDPEVITRFGHLEESAWIHVRSVAAFVVLIATLAVWVWREPSRDPRTRPLMIAFLPALAVQIALGEVQYRHGLPWEVIVFHVGVAGIVWALGLATAWTLARPSEPVAAGVPDDPVTRRAPAGAAAP